MDAKKRSRFDNSVVGGAYRVTDYDLRILQLLNRYRYLPSTYVAALLQLDGRWFKYALSKLRHRAGLVECPPASWAAANARYRPAVYALTPKGEDVLKERGLYVDHPKTGHEFNHELGACLIRASFEIGARELGLQYRGPRDILAHPDCPAATRRERSPFSIPVKFKWTNGEHTELVEQNIETDGEFFVLTGDASLVIPGFEFDRRTETLRPSSHARSSIRKKFLALREVLRQGIYQSRFGFPRASQVVPFVTISDTHLRSMMELLSEETGGNGSALFIFKSIPNFAAFETFPPPTGHMVAEDWWRVGRNGPERFNILEILKGGDSGGRETRAD